MPKPAVAVVGAGLGGLTAAILLQRAGYAVRVYEQAPEIARIGAGINLGQNILRVMRHLGLSDAMYETGLVPERHLSREWDTGRVLFDVPVQEWAAKYGMANLIMHRGDLQASLAAALDPGAIVFDRHLRDLQARPGGMRLQFADGATADADIVVGADGVDSRVREVLQGPAPPIYTGVVAYRAIFPTTLLGGKGLESDMSKWWSDERHPAAEDRHFLIYHLTRRRDEVYFVTGSPDPHWDASVSNVPAPVEEIRACYDGFHPEVMRVIDACPQATKWPLLIRPPMEHWSEGRVVLLGDACHPMKPHMGQGANMAMEDGVVLARCLEACGGEHTQAFALYEATRIGRATRVQQESFVNVWLKYPTDPGWVFAYDPLTVPLNPQPAHAVPANITMEQA